MEVVVLSGLQASGKTTFRRQRFPDHVVVSKDLMRKAAGKERRQRRLIVDALTDGRDVVVDNTNPSPEDRIPIVEIAHSYDATAVGFFFDTDFDDCVARNAKRAEVVPLVGLIDVRRRLQIPTAAEGFDQLWHVRPVGGGRFDVAPLTPTGAHLG